MESAIKVNVKWKKEVFKDVELAKSEPPSVFQTQLWTLTGVPPERQTVLLKGGKLRADTQWEKAGVRPGMTIMMMGTPDANRLPPPPKVSLVRNDLDSDDEIDMSDTAAIAHPPGLVNKGNTCYMNATVQCLAAVDPLRNSLQAYRGRTDALSHDEKMCASLRDLFSRLGSRNSPRVDPMNFLTTLRAANPQFAERGGPHNRFLQQDAEECFGEILTRLSTTLRPSGAAEGESSGAMQTGSENRVDELFGIETEYVDVCVEDESEEPVQRTDKIRMLKCHISKEVNNLGQGIHEGLEDEIEKRSENLGRTAKWKRTSKLKKIPPFVIVQFMRFFWKPVEQVRAKILRNVSLPVQLDLYDYCTDELKAQLDPKRREAHEKFGEELSPSAALTPVNEGATVAEGEEKKEDGSKEFASADIGNYDLIAVLTHKGRSLDSGHYVAWVKESASRWLKFDDDVVSFHTEEDVKKLSGGGDWHMSYVCIYGAKNTF